MSAPTLDQFQRQVSELLLRHRSLLDVMSKYDQTGSAVNRAVAKAVTECGCIELNAKKQAYSDDTDLTEAQSVLQHHMNGQLCEQCNDVLRAELGRNLFYMSALCNLLDINLEEVVARESDKCSTLGLFNMR
ncbi:nucleoside triphosphate pyrophosphohydrolase family protein [Paenibacillus kobensis]|uniref:DUF1573 domain-containing protein n=1 Tax=Paenibacillus kobensis TaxID=59841 RepID=UPI000FD824FA|nr:DUF1573 domain-containing protein [Paenibacillus kobensis]